MLPDPCWTLERLVEAPRMSKNKSIPCKQVVLSAVRLDERSTVPAWEMAAPRGHQNAERPHADTTPVNARSVPGQCPHCGDQPDTTEAGVEDPWGLSQ